MWSRFKEVIVGSVVMCVDVQEFVQERIMGVETRM